MPEPDTAPRESGFPTRLDDNLCFSIYSAGHAFTRFYKPLLDALDLTYPQYLAMIALWEDDGQTVGEMGRRLRLDSNTLTPLLKRMETAGLVTRNRDRQDERIVRVALTGKGRDLEAKAATVPACVLDAVDMDVSELRALRAQILRLRDKLDAALEKSD